MRPLILLALFLAGPASAAPERAPPSIQLYARARAAEVGGDMRLASTDFAELLAREPGNDIVVQRSYRQAMAAGDMPLALKAARLLDARHALPPDGRVLLAADALHARNWAAARVEADALQKERLFAFLAPMIRAWIALGTRTGDPLAELEGARSLALAQPYLPEQRALLLIALGRTEEGITALRGADTHDIAAWPVRTRLLAADALARAGQRERALGLLDGDDPALQAARAALTAGDRLPAPVDGPAAGVATLLVRVANDMGRQQLAPIGLALARDAAYLAPRDAGAWLTVANLLANLKQPAQAIVALDRVDPADPFASAASSLRVALLSDMGDKPAALADAIKGTAGSADPGAWNRLGDVYLALDRPADAARAYGKGVELARAARAPATVLWPLYLQQGGALDQAGDWPGAKTALNAALALAPDQALVLNQLGYSLIARRDDVVRGSDLIAKAIAIKPDDPAIVDSMGWSRFLLGKVNEAVPLLEKASAADPTEATIAEHLGDAYWAIGRFYEARYAWRAALVSAEAKDRARLSAKVEFGYTPATASP